MNVIEKRYSLRVLAIAVKEKQGYTINIWRTLLYWYPFDIR